MGSLGILMCILHEREFYLRNAFAIAYVSSRSVKFDKVQLYCENKFCRFLNFLFYETSADVFLKVEHEIELFLTIS